MTNSTNWEAWGIPLIVIAVLLFIVIVIYLLRWYIRGPMYRGTAQMNGKTVVITGGNTGIGRVTATDLAKRGAKVIILCRDVEKGKTAVEEIGKETGSQIGLYPLDLASFESIRKCAAELKENEPKIHVLINNAGVMLTPQWETKDGFEMQFGTNHLGHFLLTLLILDTIKAAAPSRIVNVSSLAHIFGRIYWDDVNMQHTYVPWKAYGQSKLANILFTKSLAEKLKGTGVTTYAVHPGLVNTELDRYMVNERGVCRFVWEAIKSLFYKTPTLGSQTSIYCAVDEKAGEDTGKYYNDCKEQRPSGKARNMEDAERLWKLSLEMVNLKDFQL